MGVEARVLLASRYRLLSIVGKGGMGTVWHARDELLGRDVAVKEVALPERLGRGESRVMCRRLIGEARATATLRHPGVVTVYDVVVEDGRPFIVMELLNARSLHEVIARTGPLPPERAAEIGRAVLAVLRVAHSRGILHRDVKPSNIMIAGNGGGRGTRILLTDFGLAVRMERGQVIEDTLVAGIEGSPAYLSPEQVRGGPGGPASDLWSLGATLYAAVEGRSPYLRAHALASMVAVLLGDYAPAEHAGPLLRQLIDGLLRQDPAERLSASHAALLLNGAAAAAPMLSASRPADRAARLAPLPPAPRRLRRTKAGAMISVATLAAVVVGVGAWTARWNSIGTSDTLSMRPVAGSVSGTMAYSERDGYVVEVPSGWTRVKSDDGVHWDDPASGRHLRISPSPGDALEGLREAERQAVAGNAYPGYRKLRLEATPEVATGAAEWEFTSARGHGLQSRIGGYEFLFTAPETGWTPGQRLYDAVLKSFRPGKRP